jgi:uncharacterized membrane protein YwzB
METHKSKIATFLLSAVLTIIILGSMIIIDEQNIAFKAFLTNLTGHHWVTKSIFGAVLFPLFSAIFFFALRSEKARRGLRANNIWAWTLLLIALTTILVSASLFNYLINYLAL